MGGRVDNQSGLELLDQPQNSRAVSNVQFVMREARQCAHQPLLVPTRAALRAKKDFALVVINAVNGKSAFVEKRRYLRTNQAGRAGEQTNFSHYPRILPVCLLKSMAIVLPQARASFFNSRIVREICVPK